MDPKIAARLDYKILQAAMRRYNISAECIEILDGFESFIYRYKRSDGHFILRIGHSSRRSPDLIRGEVDWINYLAAGGAQVARSIFSAYGNLVEPLDDGQGEEFLCTAFVHAPGREIRREHINDNLVINYGRLIGRMHALAKAYHVSNPAWMRYAWDAPENNTAERQMPAEEALALQKYREILAHLQSLPKDEDSYGMIHQDAHLGNAFVDDKNQLTCSTSMIVSTAISSMILPWSCFTRPMANQTRRRIPAGLCPSFCPPTGRKTGLIRHG
jgi:amicoumacin kinase